MEAAPAKINLALHVTGRRDDGYHLLDTMVVFADLGDALTFADGERDRLTMDGRFAGDLSGDGDNLVVQARDKLRLYLKAQMMEAPPVHIHLTKNLPVASGIGGGSADAAATLRGLSRLWGYEPDRAAMKAIAMSLGADVSMCLAAAPLRARDTGDDITMMGKIPDLPLLLVNPLQPVPTAKIFSALADPFQQPIMDRPADTGEENLKIFCDHLKTLRNDLQAPAIEFAPVIGQVLSALTGQKPYLARMSGSGATCFAVFASRQASEKAGEAIRNHHPDWFVEPTSVTNRNDAEEKSIERHR